MMSELSTEKLNKYKKTFYIFLMINMVLCFCVELFRKTICVDSMEAITWGELISFGTNKHPPLSGWLADGFYHLFFQHDIAIYLLGIICIAILITGLTGLITLTQTTGAWGASMVGFIGLILFYFFPIEFEDSTFKYFLKWLYSIMIGWQIVLLVFVLVQTKSDMGISRQKVLSDFNKIWTEATGSNHIKYVSGCNEYVFHFTLDKNSKHKVILDTFGHKNPWIDYKDVEKSGVLIVNQHEGGILNVAEEITKFLPQKYELEVKKYDYKVTNKFKKSEQYEIHYIIIPPRNNEE